MPKKVCLSSLPFTSFPTWPLGQFSLFLLSLSFSFSLLMLLFFSENSFHPYVLSAMDPTDQSSGTGTCLNILCATTLSTCEHKPLIAMLQEYSGLSLSHFHQVKLFHFIQKNQNSINITNRGFKIQLLALSLYLKSKTNSCSSSCNSPHHPDVMKIWNVICSVWLSMLLRNCDRQEQNTLQGWHKSYCLISRSNLSLHHY